MVSRAWLGLWACLDLVAQNIASPAVLRAAQDRLVWGVSKGNSPCTTTTDVLFTVAKTGGAPAALVQGVGFVTDLVVVGEYVYFAGCAQDDFFVRRVPVAGGAMETVVDTESLARVLASDGQQLFYADGGKLYRVAL